MKRFIALCIVLILAATTGKAQNTGYGLGIILGEPTGLSAKYWLSDENAVDAGLAWSFARGGSFHIHGDYLWHMFDALKAERQATPVYFGVGGRLKAGGKESARLGVRIAGGISYMVSSVPLEIFFELAPIMDLIPGTHFGLNGGIGARYFFKEK